MQLLACIAKPVTTVPIIIVLSLSRELSPFAAATARFLAWTGGNGHSVPGLDR